MDPVAVGHLRIPAQPGWSIASEEAPLVKANHREEPDEALLRMIGQGSREALSVLFRRHAGHIKNIGQRILRDSSEAEDLVQDVFLYIHLKATLYDSAKGPARSWIIQVAYTQAFQRRRKLKSHGLYELSASEEKADTVSMSRTAGAIYDQTIEGLFGRNGWKKILASLTEEQRETLTLHFFEGYTFAEIAEKLGQSYANVRNHHYRGLEKVRKHLANDELSGP
jgi:RNA polymerase sigma-70 factor, ECF subfamily